MSSTADPSRTTRPRRSSAATSNGWTVSSADVFAGARTGMSFWSSFISRYVRSNGRKATPSGAPLPSRRVQAPGQNALLGVQAVLGLVEHHRLRAIHHLVGHLF